VTTSDFGTFVGGDRTVTTAPPPPTDGHASIGHASVSGTTASVSASCAGTVTFKNKHRQ
jgi:hypothetical protein